MALTFDDLPMTGGSACDPARVREVTARLTGVLAARALPAMGLATPGRPCLTPALLAETLGAWADAGAVIGNHTATHPDLDHTSVDAYVADAARAQALIDAAVGPGERWFRHPYLHAGADPGKKRALADWLRANGYRVAPVTVDNQEWVYAAVYADARARGDDALARRVASGYLEHVEASMAFYEELSRAVTGREIPQVLLLHANLLNAEHLESLVDVLRGRGYRFVPVAEALADPAYAREDAYVGPRGLSWLQRWALADGVPVGDEPREAPWVAEAFRAVRARAEDEAAVRRALERYLAGHATGERTHFEAAFHPDARLAWVADGALRTRTGADYVAGASGRPAADEARRARRIAWIDVAGDVATARVELDHPGAFIVDYMTLARSAEGWRIVHKAYHVDRTGAASPAAAHPDGGAAAEIAAASRAFSHAYVTGDTAALRRLYTDGAILLPPGREIRGADAAARYFAPSPRRETLSHAMVSEALEIDGAVAVDKGTWTNTWRMDGGPVQEASGPYLVVWRRGGDGRWRIAYDMWHRP